MINFRSLTKRLRAMIRRPRLPRVKAVGSLYAYGIEAGVTPQDECNRSMEYSVDIEEKFKRMEREDEEAAMTLPSIKKIDEVGQCAIDFEETKKPKAKSKPKVASKSIAKKTSPPPGYETAKTFAEVSVPRKCSPPPTYAAAAETTRPEPSTEQFVRPPLTVLPGTEAWFAIPGNERPKSNFARS